MSNLYAEWLQAKETERAAVERRRAIEDELRVYYAVSELLEGAENFDESDYIVKIIGRIDRKVDADMIQELAAEYGLSDHLARLFRWKPELNMAAWRAADESITRPLAAAITAKPGRPSFQITRKEK